MKKINNDFTNFSYTDDEIGEYHEPEQDLLIHQKQLMKIENDVSLNPDTSYDIDKSKNSTLKNKEILKIIGGDSIDYYDQKNNLSNMTGGILTQIDTKVNHNYYNNNNNNNNNFIYNKNNKNNLCFEISNFQCFIPNSIFNSKKYGSQSQSFGNYNKSLDEYKNLENKFNELNNSYNTVLNLMQYWQKFYLDIVQLVSTKINDNDSNNDLLNDQFKFSVIEDVKNLIKKAKDKVDNKFFDLQIFKENNFFILNNNFNHLNNNNNNKNKFENLSLIKNFFSIENSRKKKKLKIIQNEFFSFFPLNLNSQKLRGKFYLEDDDINHLPPMIVKKKIDKGINTDKIEKQTEIKFIEKEIIKEINKLKFDLNHLKFDNNNNKNNFTIQGNEKHTKNNINKNKNSNVNNNNNNKKNNFLLKKKNSNNNNNNNNKFSLLKIEKFDNLNLISKVKKPKKIFKLTKNTMTDLTYKNIISLETLNEEYSNQVKTLEKDKNKIKKNYENQIEKLNKQLSLFKEKEEDTLKKNYITKINSFQILCQNLTEKTSNKKYNNNKEEEKINEINNNKNSNSNILNTSSAFLPEMIPPEQTYKIFVHCVKHFKYEEDLYKDYFEEEDILNLKHFVNKMEKYTYHTSIPVQRKDPFHYYKPIESASQKKYKESILMGFKPMTINIKSKSRTNSKTSKNKNKQKSYDYRNNNTSANYSYNIHNFDTTNSTFNKYKAVLRSLKNS